MGLSDKDIEALARQRGVNVFDLFEQQDKQKKVVPIDDLPAPPYTGNCDVDALMGANFNDALKTYQTDLVEAREAANTSREWPLPISIIVLAAAALPWLWYFLLRRIAELRAAISGKPPL